MRARLGPEDEEAFNAARDELSEAFRSAAEDDADDFVASTMLDYKWGYADGRIFQWTLADLEDLLLGHFPRKVVIDEVSKLELSGQIRRRTATASAVPATAVP